MSALTPEVEAAVRSAVRQAFQAGQAAGRGATALQVKQVLDYAVGQVETALILAKARADAAKAGG